MESIAEPNNNAATSPAPPSPPGTPPPAPPSPPAPHSSAVSPPPSFTPPNRPFVEAPDHSFAEASDRPSAWHARSTDWRSVSTELRDFAHRLGWRPLLGALAALGALAMVAFLLGVRIGAPPPLDLPLAGTNAAATPQPILSQEPIELLVVHIDGAVLIPGVYKIASPARLEDLVKSAGGLTTEADTTRINLAQLLSDADRIVVPSKGQPLPPGADGGGGFSQGAGGGPVNINTANEQQLVALTGVGPALASRIAKHRATHGPFKSVDALAGVSGIGPKTVDGLRDQAKV